MALERLTTDKNEKKKKIPYMCDKIHRVEAISLINSNNSFKNAIFVKMWNLGQFHENLIFYQ